MTLSSQSSRSARPGPSRRKKGGLPWRAILIIALLLGGGWYLFGRSSGDAVPPVAEPVQTPIAEATVPVPVEEAAGGGGTPGVSAPPPPSTLVRPSVVEGLKENPPPPSNAGETATGPDPGAAPPEVAPPPPSRPSGPSSAEATRILAEGLGLLDSGNPVLGRNLLSSLLLEDKQPLSASDADLIRNRLTELNSRLVFSPEPVPNDNVTTPYVVQSGDLLGSIAIRAKVPYPLLEIMNSTTAQRLQVGQNLKLLRGPVHARVSKTDFTMDLYAFGEDAAPVFLCALPVGFGANDGTPLGRWRVGKSKVTNPSWKNPRTGKFYAANDPDIPIGEYWIPITGIDGAAVDRSGFGIHGTNEPESIGSMQSMGCIRLLDGDIELVYHMLEPSDSEVVIVP